jgi:heat shock protein HslJ
VPRPAPRPFVRLRAVAFAGVIGAVAACQAPRAPGSESAFRSGVSGVDWQLIELDAKTASAGAGGRRVIVRFDADSARVGGFAGCNRFGGSYTLAGDSLRFSSLAVTRMACSEGMQLEAALLQALQSTRRYELTSTQLKLFAPSGAVARFSRLIPTARERSPDT